MNKRDVLLCNKRIGKKTRWGVGEEGGEGGGSLVVVVAR